jgi:transcription-repair coupling factor (superfamily II helicase)
LTLFVLPLEEGFTTTDFTIISEQDIFGDRFIRTVKKKKNAENLFAEAASIKIGEAVVHELHGIGKFMGLETVTVNNISHDMAKLIYDGGDRLFVPVENLDVISRYGDADENLRLDKLGGVAWQERKSKLKERIRLAASALLQIAAQRALKTAPKFEPDSVLFEEFVSRFPYTETDDQLRAIEEVLSDLASGKPMDRLICGDVGFGKTEVALRAAFVVASCGLQVAIICPTTLLARQHYANFVKRFDGLPLRVAQLSRMVNAADAKRVKAGLENGDVDVVIGTHALLSEDIRFKNLGLVTIDEEQHFGVAQKERLKKLRAEVHVLALSATPIPRSLQMALSGVRELSLIATPPVDRLAVRTFVAPFDELVIREAILRERNRGGRVFYVAPRISDLEEIYPKLQKLVPEAKFKIAHGKLTPTELDKTMNQFFDGEFDVLLSTAIVESGLDIQSANTIIIHRADMFGLSQLYQLRGRVGRGKIRAYAYFTVEPRKAMTDNALKRLEVIQGLDTLGAGFSVASHDMDIRGFGNLLGDEQSGHIKEVGIELYQKMLNEAILKAKAETPVDEGFTPDINIGASILIPDYYVEDLDLRMGLYKRAANLKTEDDIDAFRIEITDRFGKPPQEVLQLLEVIKLKILCRQARVEKIDVGPKAIVIQFHESAKINTEKLLAYVAKNQKRIKIRPDNKLVFAKDEQENFAENEEALERILKEIVGLDT